MTNTKKILKKELNTVVLSVKKNLKKISSIGAGVIILLNKPVYAMSPIQIDGMSDVAASFQNIIGYAGLVFCAGGAFGAMYGLYQFGQSFKAQDSEARHKSMLDIGAGAIAIAVGVGAGFFKSYITV